MTNKELFAMVSALIALIPDTDSSIVFDTIANDIDRNNPSIAPDPIAINAIDIANALNTMTNKIHNKHTDNPAITGDVFQNILLSQQIAKYINTNSNECFTATDIAKIFNISVQKASYWLHDIADAGNIQEICTVPFKNTELILNTTYYTALTENNSTPANTALLIRI